MRDHPRSPLALALIRSFKLALLLASTFPGSHSSALALNPSLEVSQYAHTLWTVRDGFSLGNVFAMAQTPDGYLWLGAEFGLFRFDGVRFIPLATTCGSATPRQALQSPRHARRHPLDRHVCRPCQLERRQADPVPGARRTVCDIAARRPRGNGVGRRTGNPTGRLCAIRSGRAQCYLEDGAFGTFVWSLGEDSSGALWAGAESGLWRWKPGPPKRYATPGPRVGDMSKADDGRLLLGMSGAGLRQIVGDKVEAYPIRSAMNPNALLPDR